MESMTTNEYQLLKIFLDHHFEWYTQKYPTTPPGPPSQFLEILEKTSLANAKKGLQIAINDIAEETARWTPEAVADADKRFAAAGTFTLSDVRRRYSNKYQEILRRGVIRSDTDYYLLKSICDGGGLEPGAGEAEKLSAMLMDYESNLPPEN